MAKHMPHTTRDIIDGKVTAQEFIDAFEPVLDSVEPDSKFEKLAGYVSNDYGRTKFVSMVARRILFSVFVPYTGVDGDNGTEERYQVPDEFEEEFCSEVAARILSATADADVDLTPSDDLVNIIKKAGKDTCASFAHRVDTELFPGRRPGERFLDIFSLYAWHSQVIKKYTFSSIKFFYDHQIFGEFKMKAWCRLDGAVNSLDQNVILMVLTSTCWECENECANLLTCSACGVAKYCKCQKIGRDS